MERKRTAKFALYLKVITRDLFVIYMASFCYVVGYIEGRADIL
jgi:hypothetical protein